MDIVLGMEFLNKNALLRTDHLQGMLKVGGIDDEIGNVEILARGTLNSIVRVAFRGRRADVVLRSRDFNHAEYGQEFAAERFVYPLISSCEIRVPELFFVGVNSADPNQNFAIFEYVPGVLFDRYLTTTQHGLPEGKMLLEKIAKSLVSIHKIKSSGYGDHTRISHSRQNRRAFLEWLVSRELPRLQHLKIDFARNFETAMKVWVDLVDELSDGLSAPTLLHGDIHGRNLIVDPTGEVCFIDWEASRFRIAPFDLAQIRFLNMQHDLKSYRYFVECYRDLSDFPIESQLFNDVIELCEVLWQCRMGLFFLEFPQFESSYLGSAKLHLDNVRAATARF